MMVGENWNSNDTVMIDKSDSNQKNRRGEKRILDVRVESERNRRNEEKTPPEGQPSTKQAHGRRYSEPKVERNFAIANVEPVK